ncbi:Uncharacterised protein [Enterobacter hormaechei]|uniref:hypothetical protein n=1 Tax=Enterobacter hormaechei TaxID=158836 RepID=UPI00079A1D87|nr:hypothetical protein [Enterobacter hormaechei]MDK7079355.1 hypothetical protein [Enterobacter hormaechei]MDK7105893.1 hypothetical protein [Enterobacter hormaechei]MDK7619516.1 hypothetical protein [Enterobacter hormaechei]MDK7864964.1 hypothetical protein [Enterobacter hormaechei]SAG92608.1 Uncharacterised protein [Enterobacter hormaechei]
MAELTKEWLLRTIAELEEERDAVPGVVNVDAAMALAAMKLALSSLEAKDKIPELRQVIYHFRDWNEGFPVERFKADYVISWMLVNYPPAQQAQVSVPDERYQYLSELYHAQEKRLFKLAQRINGASFDKYAYSPSQAIDVLESAIFGEREDDCRAAILQGADRPQNEPQNIPENIPATQFKPVADLYGLTSPTGSETSFTFDAVEARDFIDGGWSCQEYVELERYQEAVSGNYPIIPDGWVLVPIEPTYQMCEAMGLQWESPRFQDRYKAMLSAVKK